jgi:hypothetical protein
MSGSLSGSEGIDDDDVVITPEAYAGESETTEARDRMRARSVRQRELFTREEQEAMEPNGPCLAKRS